MDRSNRLSADLISNEEDQSDAKSLNFVPGERCCEGERLADIFLFQIGQLLHDLRWRHAVGDEVDHVGDRDTKAADRGSPGQDIRVLRDAFERVRHGLPLRAL